MRPTVSYKAPGMTVLDETGTKDNTEFINIAKDDIFSWPTVARRTYPSAVNARMEGTVVPFVRKSAAINDTILEILNDLLGLPAGTLAEKHKADEYSGSEARVIKSPPRPGGIDEAKAAVAAHTDFGSLVSSYLFAVCYTILQSDLTACHSRSYTTASVVSKSWYPELIGGNMSR